MKWLTSFLLGLSLPLFSNPQRFEIGIADSFFQSCGLGLSSSDWQDWIGTRFPDGAPHIDGDPQLDTLFVDYLDHPEIIIQKLQYLGVTTYRFSLERSVLEPEEGKFDKLYIQRYRNFIQQLLDHGIQPMLTLHHFVNPDWFLKKGGFEKSENIEGFVRYCDKMFGSFGSLVTRWVTINEPAIYAFQAYVRGVYPPGQVDMALAGEVMKNLLVAHCRVYEVAKQKNPALQVGISHNWLCFEAYYLYHPIERMVCHYLSEITHHTVMRFFQTGSFSFYIPFVANVEHQEPQAPNCLDFIGVQYYTKPIIKVGLFSAESTCYPEEKMTQMRSRFYPQGLEQVLEEAATLNRPIWITETGCDTDQPEYFEKVFNVASRAIAKGIPLKGILIWTIRDNLEWERGEQVQIGLYTRDFQEKPGAQAVRDLFQHSRD